MTDSITDAQLELVARDPRRYFEDWDFRATETRDRTLALVAALIDTFVRSNVEVATTNYEDDEPPGGYHFVPQRWVGPDEDAAGSTIAVLLDASTSLFTPPTPAAIEACLGEIGATLRGPIEDVALAAWRSSVAYVGQLAAEVALHRLADRRFQQRDSARSRAEFGRLLPLLSDELPRTLIATLVETLFELSAELGTQLAERDRKDLVNARVRHQLSCLEDEASIHERRH